MASSRTQWGLLIDAHESVSWVNVYQNEWKTPEAQGILMAQHTDIHIHYIYILAHLCTHKAHCSKD